jgi:two-component system, OmpR family, phosphate regulon sensor histidine kinase PhoR
VRFRAPANIFLRRAQLVLMLAALVPTILLTATGIMLLILGSGSVAIVAGILVLAFCTTAVTGYILGSIFVSRGASLTRMQNDFLSAVSHELRTPLTSISLFIETLRDDRLEDAEEKQKCLDLMGGEVKRLDLLVNRLLELTRIETGRHLMAREPVRVDDVLADAVAAYEVASLEQPSPLTLEIEPDLMVTGDRPMLSRAVTNLLVNAWKYSPADRRAITLTARPQGDDRLEIVVSDQGPGIPRSEHKAIFEKFERGQLAIDGQTGGVGLGLSIVSAIVRAHKGTVEVRSRTGHGAEFRIVLPRRRRNGTEAAR